MNLILLLPLFLLHQTRLQTKLGSQFGETKLILLLPWIAKLAWLGHPSVPGFISLAAANTPSSLGCSSIIKARRRCWSAGMEGLTESEIAGFAVGAFLLGASIAAQRVDGFIATSQRRSLNMCKRCGDLRMVACSQCKGVGSVRKGGTSFAFGMLDDIYESLGAETNAADLVACSNCRSKGRLRCPECSKVG